MLKIEKGIPIPRFTSGKKEYPFETLQIGDSFFRPCLDKNEAVVIANSIRALASRRGKDSKKSFTVRLVAANGFGVRCWRIK
jgi:hypothetical protein